MESPKSIDLPALTGLRFVAAFYVFLFHIQIRTPFVENEFAIAFLSQGAVGMTIFFMLSGYILTHRYTGKHFSDRDFVVSRFARIYPVYIVSFVLAVPMLYFQFDDLRFGIWSALAQIGVIIFCVLFMIQAWFPMLFSYVNNSASWSLSVEAFFYSTFLLIHRRIAGLRVRHQATLVFMLWTVSVVTAIAYYAFENRPQPGLMIFYAMPIFRLSEFMIGMCIYHIVKRNLNARLYASRLAPILLAFSIVYLATFGPLLPIYIGHNWIIIPLVATVLVALSQEVPSRGKAMFSSGLMVYLGKISYCFYCFQFHVLAALTFLMPDYKNQGVTYFLLCLGVLLICSSFFYHALEEPARKYISQALKSPKPTTWKIQHDPLP